MGILKKLFGLSKENVIEEENYISNDNQEYTEEIDNIIVDNVINQDKIEEQKEEIDEEKDKNVPIEEEVIEYVYPFNLIKNDNIRNAIEGIPVDNGINIPIGLSENNEWLYFDITKLPNLLIGGTVMSGKTNLINMILLSIISRYKPDEIKLVISGSKVVDYSCYNGVPHLLIPVVTDSKKASIALKKIVVEMENRYEIFERNGNKNITTYNDRIRKENESLPDNEKKKLMPCIVVIVDDYVSLSKNFENEYNESIEKLSQFGWGAGIHLIMVANHPTSKILSSLSLVNFPSRVSFKVPSSKDSRMILNEDGAEKLYGVGNALLKTQLLLDVINISTILVDDEDIKSVIDAACRQIKAHYDETLVMDDEELRASDTIPEGKDVRNTDEEPLLDEIIDFVIEQGKASTSLIQRRFRLGYNRAARDIDLLENMGIIGPQKGTGTREVLKDNK